MVRVLRDCSPLLLLGKRLTVLPEVYPPTLFLPRSWPCRCMRETRLWDWFEKVTSCDAVLKLSELYTIWLFVASDTELAVND